MSAALLIDTAGPVVGIAAFPAGSSTAGFVSSQRIVAGADGWLTPTLGEALDSLAGATVGLRVGVVVGPGAFTGIRVGMAHALGLALARGGELVALSSLALRASMCPGRARVLAVLDGKKGRVYAGLFDTRGEVALTLGAEVDLPPAAIPAWVLQVSGAAVGPVTVVGEGASVFRPTWEAASFTVADAAHESPVGRGGALLRCGAPVDAADLHPRYLREPDAVPPPHTPP